ncbi:MAG: RNA pseudouridine synthase [Aliivibrio sp.]|uniref:RluA family pseudouridine synthase n=1 Tax=Aliivibrio sp. TaxID=1872443 RepID=UPI001A58FEF3|nr:RNA pseudouridine synthase [Aliivibrio sp.]
MHSQPACFTLFKKPIDSYSLPERFTFPFFYQPHPLCKLAIEELQHHLNNQQTWQHNFGLAGDKASGTGKMFGVLLVQTQQGEIGYLSAFSGKTADSNHLAGFVPPVFDMLTKDGFFLIGQEKLNRLSAKINTLRKNPNIELYTQRLNDIKSNSQLQIENHRSEMIEGRKRRKILRAKAEQHSDPTKLTLLMEKLGRESVNEKNQLKTLKNHWDKKLAVAQDELNQIVDEIIQLKGQRSELSSSLQQKIFQQYQFLNSRGESKSLQSIFADTPMRTPPAGSGECAAPKLLHYAFNHQLKPLALAEFWWGVSPKSEVRQHKNIYPACLGKCHPILGHMLEGIEQDENPLLTNPAIGKSIEVIYQDDVMLVINKPAGFLSVPGKTIEDSVQHRMEQLFPKSVGSLIVHRLDMATSGLMVIALSKRAHKSLQKQFISRSITKRYIALIDGTLDKNSGEITLPLRGDLIDRPRQLVCFEHGKPAETEWQVIDKHNGNTRVYLSPKTGRTHQLRVHCAHSLGLAMPIIGDDLYGKTAKRLHLHAESLTLHHPITKEVMQFQVDPDF